VHLKTRLLQYEREAQRLGYKPFDQRARDAWEAASIFLQAYIVTRGPFISVDPRGKAMDLPDRPGDSLISARLFARCIEFADINGWGGRQREADQAMNKGQSKGKAKPGWYDQTLAQLLAQAFGPTTQEFVRHSSAVYANAPGPGKGQGQGQGLQALPATAQHTQAEYTEAEWQQWQARRAQYTEAEWQQWRAQRAQYTDAEWQQWRGQRRADWD
jgi:hypothetical protein